MSAIGRIFIVLNLILAAAFLGWASQALGSMEDYKDKYEKQETLAQAAAEEANDAASKLRIEITNLRDDARTANAARDTASALSGNLQGQYEDAQRDNSSMQGKLDEIAKTLGDYNDTISRLGREKDDAVTRANEAQNESNDKTDEAQAAEMARRDAAGAVEAAKRRIADLEASNAEMMAKVSSMDARIKTIVAATGYSVENIEQVPQIEAAVLEARFDVAPGLVMLNVGRSSGVERGYTFHIYRGGQYKGQVRVENVQSDYCSAVVVGVQEGRTMSQGDQASTIL